jgi:hypothetical protein
MNDVVEVAGAFRNTPLLKFVQKGKGVTNLTGEKLYEGQVIEAVQGELARHRIRARFFTVVADEERMAYRLLIEGRLVDGDGHGLADTIDQRLGEINLEYHAKRSSGRLAPLSVAWLSEGAADAWKAEAVARGQREGQLKPPALQYGKELIVAFDTFIVA